MVPHRILAAVPDPCGLPVASIFRACIVAPRGGPRTEPPRPSGCWPTTPSLYLRGRWFHFVFFLAFATPRALRAFAVRAPLAAVRHQGSSLRRSSRRSSRSSTPPRFRRGFFTASVSSAASATPSSSPSLFIFAASPAIIAFYTFRLRLASISPHFPPFAFQLLGR